MRRAVRAQPRDRLRRPPLTITQKLGGDIEEGLNPRRSVGVIVIGDFGPEKIRRTVGARGDRGRQIDDVHSLSFPLCAVGAYGDGIGCIL